MRRGFKADSKSVVRVLLSGFIFLGVTAGAFSAEGRTWRQPEYTVDPAFNPSFEFGVYSDVEGYEEPDRAELNGVPSPLYNPIYASYDAIIVIQKSDFQSKGSDVLERGQRLRAYVRKSALERMHPNQIYNTNYDEASGLLFYFKTSTAKAGASTPVGHYLPQTFSSDHYSSSYNNSPMPYSMFFVGHIATHGTIQANVPKLGSPASMGCARLETQRAEDLFHLIGLIGKGPVDQLTPQGAPIVDKAGAVQQTVAYKTLIIVRP